MTLKELWDDSNAKVQYKPRDSSNQTRPWDVGTHWELQWHYYQQDKCTLIHFPPLETLEQFKFLSEETTAEKKTGWMAMAVPTDRIADKKLAELTVKAMLEITTTPQEVGAVRRLFRDSIKEYATVAGHSSIGKTPSEFWKAAPVAREETSLEITEKLNSFSK